MASDLYKAAGVDITAGNALVEAIKPLARATARPGASAALGGFAAVFDPKAAGFRDPLLLAATDGVGTKLKLAIETGRHDTIGIDLVAMCVNDLVVHGAEPLFFLDYFGTGRLEPTVGTAVVAGIAEGCRQAGCALIGGETAELPGLYQSGDYDLAGFTVGAVERDCLLPREDILPGDVILGLAASGLHSNGYSLVRRIVAGAGAPLDAQAPFVPDLPPSPSVAGETAADRTLGAVLLTPTRIYVRSVLAAARAGGLKAAAHITGGGLVENIPRVLPAGTCAVLDAARWPRPAVFGWLESTGGVDRSEMLRVFNNGLGMVLIVAADAADGLTALLRSAGETVYSVGVIEKATASADADRVVLTNGATAWRS